MEDKKKQADEAEALMGLVRDLKEAGVSGGEGLEAIDDHIDQLLKKPGVTDKLLYRDDDLQEKDDD
jgi:hypothetical protein